MPSVADPTDRLVAELLEQLGRASDGSEACSVVVERVARAAGVERALIAVASEDDDDIRAVAWDIAEDRPAPVPDALREPDSPLAVALDRREPALLEQSAHFPQLDFSSYAVLPFETEDADISGVLILEADELDERTEFASDVLGRCGPTIARSFELEGLRARADTLGSQHRLLSGITENLPDPILLTDQENRILFANPRAEELFSKSSDASEGRRRAIEINNLLFSSFLTQGVISGQEARGRELNLADPSDGTDLLFEVLSFPASDTTEAEGSVVSILRDISDLKHAVAELETEFSRTRGAEHRARQERDQLNIMLENVADPILVTDDESDIMLMNREAERLFVAPLTASPESAERRVVRANDTRFTTMISDFLLQMDQSRTEKMQLTDPDTSREFPAEVVSSKILNSRGEPDAIVSVVHDLTQAVENERLARELQELNEDLENRIRRATVELEERNRRLEWQSRELERAYRMKSQFLASMSHELRTPINVIIGYASLMREQIYGELTNRQQEALEKVHTTSEHLLELINDILDLSKIEAGKMPVHTDEVVISELIEEVSATLDPLLRDKSLEYTAELADDLPMLCTDRTKLKQILLNLLSNAIKFTREGSVRLAVEPTEAPDGPDADDDGVQHVRIVVEDTGIGIKAEDLDVIFDDFRQVDQSSTREFGGTGLGLSITKKLVTLLDGEITVESAYGEGTRFSIVIPVTTEAGSVDEQVHRAAVDSDRAIVRH